jgi:hypothetical protein
VESFASAPGPPPLPPSGLATRPLPLHDCPAGTLLARIHPAHLGALFFGPLPGSPPRGRWDAPAGEFGVCYLAEEPHAAFAETFLRQPGLMVIDHADLESRCLAMAEVRRDLRLVAMHGRGLARMGATAAVCSGPYAVSRAWARALHDHPAKPDGIRYRARHDDDGFAVALFGRAADAVVLRGSEGLMERTGQLGGWLDRYGVGLV